MDLLNTAWLGTGDWQSKVADARRKRHEKASYGRKPGAPPAVVQDKRDVDTARLKAAQAKRQERFEKALAEHWPLQKFVTILREQEATFEAPTPGVLDVDLAELAVHLKLKELPHAVRFLAIEEVHACVSRVNKRVHGCTDDDIPFGIPGGATLTLQDFKAALETW